MNGAVTTGVEPAPPAHRRRQRGDDGVVVELVEEHERHQLLVRMRGLRRQHAVAARAPPQPGPVREQVADVDASERVRVVRRRPCQTSARPEYGASCQSPSIVGCGDEHLQPARARLPVEHGDRAEVGVRPDPVLPVGGLPDLRQRRVAVDVERPGRVRGQRRQRGDRQAQRGRAQLEQVVRDAAHRRGVARHDRAQLRHLGRPDVGGNHTASTAASPVGVSGPTANDSLRSGGSPCPRRARSPRRPARAIRARRCAPRTAA